MREEEIEYWEEEARLNWYDDGEEIDHVPSGYIKEYRFGRYRDVVLYKFKDFAVVEYIPTGIKRKFNDIDRAFEFARARARHANAIARLLE